MSEFVLIDQEGDETIIECRNWGDAQVEALERGCDVVCELASDIIQPRMSAEETHRMVKGLRLR